MALLGEENDDGVIIIVVVGNGLVLAAGMTASSSAWAQSPQRNSGRAPLGFSERVCSCGEQVSPGLGLCKAQATPGRVGLLGPSVPRGRRRGFLGRRNVRSGARDPPHRLSRPLLRRSLRTAGSRNKESPRCVSRAAFSPSAWKASQRGPRPQPPWSPGERGAADPVGLRGPAPRSPSWRGLGGNAGGRDPVLAEGPRGRGPARITVCTDRLEEIGAGRGLTHLSGRETWPLGPGARCLRKGPPISFQRAPSGFSPPAKPLSRRGLSGSVIVVFPPPFFNLYPLHQLSFLPLPFLSSLDG